MPIFALANAGVRLDGETLARAATSPIAIGTVAGLVLGKIVGICLGSWLALRTNLGVLPGNLVWGQLLGGSAVAGIGFTVSLFITDLAFTDPTMQDEAKVGILVGSLAAATIGWLVFGLVWNRGAVCAPPDAQLGVDGDERPDRLTEPVTEADPALGPADAPITLVEYGDYECPYCGRAHAVLRGLRERYGDELRVVFRHFPLPDVHPRAVAAALSAEAAADYGWF